MSNFNGSIHESKGSSTRHGTKNSGIREHIKDIGVNVLLYVDANGDDIARITLISGSKINIGEFKLVNGRMQAI